MAPGRLIGPPVAQEPPSLDSSRVAHQCPGGCGEALQLVKLNKGQRCVDVNEESLASLQANLHRRGAQRIAIVSVVGAVGTGKSFLMDLFLRYLRHGESDSRMTSAPSPLPARGQELPMQPWLTASSETLDGATEETSTQGFRFKGGMDTCTEGIWVWSEPFMRKVKGRSVAILLMDTQGAWDSNMTKEQSLAIFGLAAVLSSKQIYNINSQIREDEVENLALLMQGAHAAIKKASDDRAASDQQRGQALDDKPFQSLDFLVRNWKHFREDWTLECCKAQMAEHFAKHLHKNKVVEKPQAEVLHNMFQEMGCFCLPHPGPSVERESWSGNVYDLSSDFRLFVDAYTRDIFSRDLGTRNILGLELTTGTLPLLLRHFADSFCGIASAETPFAQAMAQEVSQIHQYTKLFHDLSNMLSTLQAYDPECCTALDEEWSGAQENAGYVIDSPRFINFLCDSNLAATLVATAGLECLPALCAASFTSIRALGLLVLVREDGHSLDKDILEVLYHAWHLAWKPMALMRSGWERRVEAMPGGAARGAESQQKSQSQSQSRKSRGQREGQGQDIWNGCEEDAPRQCQGCWRGAKLEDPGPKPRDPEDPRRTPKEREATGKPAELEASPQAQAQSQVQAQAPEVQDSNFCDSLSAVVLGEKRTRERPRPSPRARPRPSEVATEAREATETEELFSRTRREHRLLKAEKAKGQHGQRGASRPPACARIKAKGGRRRSGGFTGLLSTHEVLKHSTPAPGLSPMLPLNAAPPRPREMKMPPQTPAQTQSQTQTHVQLQMQMQMQVQTQTQMQVLQCSRRTFNAPPPLPSPPPQQSPPRSLSQSQSQSQTQFQSQSQSQPCKSWLLKLADRQPQLGFVNSGGKEVWLPVLMGIP